MNKFPECCILDGISCNQLVAKKEVEYYLHCYYQTPNAQINK